MSVIDSSCMGESSLSCPNVSSVKASSADEKGGCRFEVLESSFFFFTLAVIQACWLDTVLWPIVLSASHKIFMTGIGEIVAKICVWHFMESITCLS